MKIFYLFKYLFLKISYYSKQFQTCYGFTEKEIRTFLKNLKLPEDSEMKIIKEWYEGYKFGEEKIFNPFAVNNYLTDENATKE